MKWFGMAEAIDEFLDFLLVIAAGASLGTVFMLVMLRVIL